MITLLLVDDEVLVLDALKSQIRWESLGIDRALTAYSVRQAKELFEKHAIDIMLCDIEMPRGSGLDLLNWVRAEGHNTVAIFLTAHADFEYAKQAITLGSMDYVLKPILFSALEEVVRRAVDRVHTRRETENYALYGKRWMSRHVEPIATEEPQAEESIVDAICRYIHEHVGRALSREDIAAYVNLSPEYVSRIFHKEKQVVLSSYIQRVKIDAAKRALTESRLTISDIAGKLGFENFAYFSKVFKKLEGMSPVDYRKDIQKKSPDN